MKWGRLLTPVSGGNKYEEIFRRCFGVFHPYVEIPVIAEDTGIEQLELGVVPAAPAVLLQQTYIGKLLLRILIQIFHVGMSRRAVEIKVIFLGVLAVIALVARQSEDPFLQKGVPFVP